MVFCSSWDSQLYEKAADHLKNTLLTKISFTLAKFFKCLMQGLCILSFSFEFRGFLLVVVVCCVWPLWRLPVDFCLSVVNFR